MLRGSEVHILDRFPQLRDERYPELPDELTFLHAEEILERYPDLPRKKRETAILQDYPAIFIYGIGWTLADGYPHEMRAPDSDDWDPKEKKEWPKKKWTRKHFREMVAYADKMVGKIDRALDELGIRENTLLIFTCDNGTYTGITSPFMGKQLTGKIW